MESNRLIEILDRMEELQKEFFCEMRIQLIGVNLLPFATAKADEKLMNRLQVQAYLDISRTTYNRKVKEGKLKPMKLPGGHKYHKSDLFAEYKESKRRGRI